MMRKKIDNNKLQKVCKKNDVVFLGVFGSFIREDLKEKSDIDLLVRFSRPKSLLELVKIERKFSEFFGRKADMLTEGSISPYLIDRIKKEVKVYYGRA